MGGWTTRVSIVLKVNIHECEKREEAFGDREVVKGRHYRGCCRLGSRKQDLRGSEEEGHLCLDLQRESEKEHRKKAQRGAGTSPQG